MRVCFSVPSVEPGIVAALVAAAKEARKDRNISPEEMAVALKRSGPGSASKVSRFENGEHYGEIDRVFNTYLEETELSLLDLLAAAEKKIPKSALAKKRSPAKRSAAAERATQAARQARVEMQQSREKSSDRRSPKATKRRAQ